MIAAAVMAGTLAAVVLAVLTWTPPRDPAALPARRRHPSARPVPGIPADGQPLTPAENRALGHVEMDALITIAEPQYGQEKSR